MMQRTPGLAVHAGIGPTRSAAVFPIDTAPGGWWWCGILRRRRARHGHANAVGPTATRLFAVAGALWLTLPLGQRQWCLALHAHAAEARPASLLALHALVHLGRPVHGGCALAFAAPLAVANTDKGQRAAQHAHPCVQVAVVVALFTLR